MKIVLVGVVFGILYLINLPGLLRDGFRRDLMAFTLLMFISFLFSVLLALGVKLPFLGVEIAKIFKAFLR